ncbi:endonuclease domain-containing protein [Sphingomonas sp. CJ20]
MPAIRRRTSPHAATLRRTATDAERALWAILRNRGLAGAKFRRQASIEPYVVDFLCIEHQLIVEVDGSQHTEDVDAARTAFLEAKGYRVIRFWNTDVLENLEGVATTIAAALEER